MEAPHASQALTSATSHEATGVSAQISLRASAGAAGEFVLMSWWLAGWYDNQQGVASSHINDALIYRRSATGWQTAANLTELLVAQNIKTPSPSTWHSFSALSRGLAVTVEALRANKSQAPNQVPVIIYTFMSAGKSWRFVNKQVVHIDDPPPNFGSFGTRMALSGRLLLLSQPLGRGNDHHTFRLDGTKWIEVPAARIEFPLSRVCCHSYTPVAHDGKTLVVSGSSAALDLALLVYEWQGDFWGSVANVSAPPGMFYMIDVAVDGDYATALWSDLSTFRQLLIYKRQSQLWPEVFRASLNDTVVFGAIAKIAISSAGRVVVNYPTQSGNRIQMFEVAAAGAWSLVQTVDRYGSNLAKGSNALARPSMVGISERAVVLTDVPEWRHNETFGGAIFSCNMTRLRSTGRSHVFSGRCPWWCRLGHGRLSWTRSRRCRRRCLRTLNA